ncbi:hypothetical protein CEXT_256501 [Caerostris extrusa]|uniref:Uncharacterized protein n=1 Tax=Caerostris extrusa TaxID=172846 RepID=A0AAV4W6V8_CAEEX|nr:hypothetical protein CEXT_256501 [Caerostris extrusa]
MTPKSQKSQIPSPTGGCSLSERSTNHWAGIKNAQESLEETDTGTRFMGALFGRGLGQIAYFLIVRWHGFGVL